MVEMTGFEPAASSSRTKRATKLRYISKCNCLNIIAKQGAFVNLFSQKRNDGLQYIRHSPFAYLSLIISTMRCTLGMERKLGS